MGCLKASNVQEWTMQSVRETRYVQRKFHVFSSTLCKGEVFLNNFDVDINEAEVKRQKRLEAARGQRST